MVFSLALSLGVLVIYLLTRIGNRGEDRKNKLFLLLTFVVFFVLIASREMTMGNDTQPYLRIYEMCDTYKWGIFDMGIRYEPGFLVFNIILSYLHVSPRLFLCITALIFSAAVYKFIKDNSHSYLMSVLLFINLLFFFQSMSIMRQFMALSIILFFGFKFIKEKKILKYAITVIAAALFHYTALIAFLLYPLYYLRYSRKRILIIAVCAVLISVFMSRIYSSAVLLFDMETDYTYMIGEAKLNNIISTLIFLAMYVFSLFVIKKEKKQDYSFYLYSLFFTTAVYFISVNMAVLSRMSQYFAIVSIIALPNVIEANIKESKLLVEAIIISLFATYAAIIMINKPEWNSAYNYKSCLMPEEGYICE